MLTPASASRRAASGERARLVREWGLDRLDLAERDHGVLEDRPGRGIVGRHEGDAATVGARRAADGGDVDAGGGDRLGHAGQLAGLVAQLDQERVHRHLLDLAFGPSGRPTSTARGRVDGPPILRRCASAPGFGRPPDTRRVQRRRRRWPEHHEHPGPNLDRSQSLAAASAPTTIPRLESALTVPNARPPRGPPVAIPSSANHAALKPATRRRRRPRSRRAGRSGAGGRAPGRRRTPGPSRERPDRAAPSDPPAAPSAGPSVMLPSPNSENRIPISAVDQPIVSFANGAYVDEVAVAGHQAEVREQQDPERAIGRDVIYRAARRLPPRPGSAAGTGPNVATVLVTPTIRNGHRRSETVATSPRRPAPRPLGGPGGPTDPVREREPRRRPGGCTGRSPTRDVPPPSPAKPRHTIRGSRGAVEMRMFETAYRPIPAGPGLAGPPCRRRTRRAAGRRRWSGRRRW